MRRAFTLVELCMGLALTALMMAAAASFMLGTATAWKASEDSQANAKASQQLSGRLQSMIRNCAAIGAVTAGSGASPAGALVWVTDTNADGKVQTSELALISHDPTSKQLQAQFPVVSGPDSTWTAAAFNARGAVDSIRSMTTKSHCFVRNVNSVVFAVIRPAAGSVRTTLEYDIVAKRNNGTDRYYGSASMRAPVEPK